MQLHEISILNTEKYNLSVYTKGEGFYLVNFTDSATTEVILILYGGINSVLYTPSELQLSKFRELIGDKELQPEFTVSEIKPEISVLESTMLKALAISKDPSLIKEIT